MKNSLRSKFPTAVLLAISMGALFTGLNSPVTQARTLPDTNVLSATIDTDVLPATTNTTPPTTITPTTTDTHPIEYYTNQAGLTNPSNIGQVKWIDGCQIAVQQGAATFNSGKTETCFTQPTEPGWQIIEYKLEVLENKSNRGSYAGSILAQDGQFIVNEQDIGAKWKVAIDLSIKAKDVEATRKLEVEYQRNLQLIRNYSATKNTFYLEATANGGVFRKSVVHIKSKLKLVRIS